MSDNKVRRESNTNSSNKKCLSEEFSSWEWCPNRRKENHGVCCFLFCCFLGRALLPHHPKCSIVTVLQLEEQTLKSIIKELPLKAQTYNLHLLALAWLQGQAGIKMEGETSSVQTVECSMKSSTPLNNQSADLNSRISCFQVQPQSRMRPILFFFSKGMPDSLLKLKRQNEKMPKH